MRTLGNKGDGIYDRVELKYNRQGEVTERKDQNGTVHQYLYDALGRQVADKVTTLGTGVDGAVRRIERSYEVRGMLEKTTSYDAVTGGNPLNEVVFEYGSTALLANEYQEHSGPKDGNTLYAGYNYDTTASSGVFTKGLRPTSVRYPNGRLVHFTYGTAGEANDAMSRLAAINDDNSGNPGNSVAEYMYLGLGAIVVEDYPQPDVKLNFDSGTAGEYAGFDRFGRVVDHLWRDYGASADRDRYTYGYDRASNRLYRENTTASGKDEFYTYDGVNQLKTFDRGDLNAQKTAISGTPVREEDWTLDMTGNWTGYIQKTSGSTDLNQTRGHNKANEITSASSWTTPVHDRAGNMTTVPKPSSLANGLTLKYDAWNRLMEVKDGQTVVGKYEYDGQNRRIKKHIDSQSPGSPNGIDRYEHFFYNSQWQIVEIRDTTTMGDQAESLQPKYQYVWSARYIDAPVLRDKNTDADGLCDDGRIYYLGDANYNVTSVVDTNGDGVERYLYDAYGKVTIYDDAWSNTRSSSAYSISHLYTGRELNTESRIYHYRNRYYGPTLGRFLSRDPIAQSSQGMLPSFMAQVFVTDPSLYRYAGNAPVQAVDPTGLWTAPVSCYKECMKCGPEIGSALELTLLNIRTRLQNISWYTKAIAKTKLDLMQGWGSWDITGLVSLEHQGACFAQRVGTICETCVEVYGVKQDVWEVNYSLWGEIMASLDVSLTRAIAMAAGWKTAKWAAIGEPNQCRPRYQFNSTIVAWITTGYKMYSPWFWQTPGDVFNANRPSQDNDRFEKCESCGRSAAGPFSYNLLDDLGGTGKPPRR